MQSFVEVVFPLPLDQTFTYSVPDDSPLVKIGHRVLVPFKHRTLTGFVVSLPKEAGEFRTKSLEAVLDDQPVLTPELIQLARTLAELHGRSVGEAMQTLLPPGLIRQTRRRVVATGREDPPHEKEERNLWQQLRQGRGLDFLHLIRKTPGSAQRIRKLEEGGWLRVETVLKAERAKAKKKLWIRLVENHAENGSVRGKQQIRVVEELRACGGETFLDPLRERIPEVRRILSSLVHKKVVTFEYRDEAFCLESAFLNEGQKRIELTEAQKNVIARVSLNLKEPGFSSFLLHGVTGSGKTEVYLQLAEQALAQGKTVLALVPEISLTPQFVGRFQGRFGERVAVLHSGRSESERLTDWMRIQAGRARLVIGARSAVFAPLANLGLLILDEEHDSSYKQEEGLLYDARHVAGLRAKFHGAVLLRGSATPSMESFQNAKDGGECLLELPERVTPHPLPLVEIVDLRRQVKPFGEGTIFSDELRNAITETLERNEQTILFLNRRGFSPIVLCPTCGKSLRCDQCAVSLTFHQKSRHYLCHYCGLEKGLEHGCPTCGHAKWVHLGIGTEKVEQELAQYFPDARLVRMDRDTVRRKEAHEHLLSTFSRGDGDILIGTQMVTKGLDLARVSLVGVLLADQSLHFPDFRSAERTFQLLTQVIGRSGRGKTQGRAIIQTFQPEHYSIQMAAAQNYGEFFAKESGLRRELKYPPFSKLLMIEVMGRVESDVRQGAMWLGKQARQHGGKRVIEVLGPSPAPLSQVAGWYRYHLLLRSEKGESLAEYGRWLNQAGTESLKSKGVSLRLDLFPQNFL